jgi:tyrosine-specific transport protein
MNSKLIGGTLLVIGTTIGAGMLALPVATAQLGFWGSLVLLIGCWGIMTACAFLFLEVNLWLPANCNLISMAGATLGRAGQVLAWIVYLLLLYSIISAYIAGGGDLFHYLLSSRGIHLPAAVTPILFTLLFGTVVYLGMRAVDYVNRFLMFGKMGAYFLLAVFMLPFISVANLSGGHHYFVSANSITVTAVSFGSLMIIPSLRTYFGEDISSLRKAIFIGTLIPLFCYIAWDLVIMGIVPLDGSMGLKQMVKSSTSNSDLVASITAILQSNTVTALAKFFTSICMATSFLSISLCLSDFLSDGLRVSKKGLGNIVIFGATFLPPLIVVLFYPDAFIRGLSYAGISIIILMVLMPPLMVWFGRYRRQLAQVSIAEGQGAAYQVAGGKFLLALLVLFATLMIVYGFKGTI